MKNLIKKMSIACLAITLFSCSDDDNNTPAPQTIADIAIAGADFSILETALTRTNLVATLDGTGSFTVFAPTNDAFNTFFASLGAGVNVNNVNEDVLKAILLNHVINEKITSANIPASVYKNTLSQIFNLTSHFYILFKPRFIIVFDINLHGFFGNHDRCKWIYHDGQFVCFFLANTTFNRTGMWAMRNASRM